MAVQTGVTERLEDYTLVDADVHVGTVCPRDQLHRYVDDEYRDVVERAGGSIGNMVVDYDGWVGGEIEDQSEELEGPEDFRQRLCVEFPVDYPVVNNIGFLPAVPQDDLAVALMRANNDLFLDVFLDEWAEAFGLVDLAPQRPEAAADELDRFAAEDQVVGGLVLNTGLDRPIGHPRHDPIFEAASRHDMPIAFHAGTYGIRKSYGRQYASSETMAKAHVLSHPYAQMRSLVSLIEHAVPERFPDLDFVFLEAGIGWVPTVVGRLQREYEHRSAEMAISTPPAELVREAFYFGTQPLGEPRRNTDLHRLVELAGPESIMFATDFPHWDFDSPAILDAVLQTDLLTRTERERVLHRNAAEVFGLDV